MAYDIKNTKVIYLGRQGENLARTIEIDVSSMLMKWPDATISLLVQRNQEDTFYLAPVVIENGILKWTITNADTEIAGIGKIEVRAIQDDAIMKSATMKICVENSLGGTETDVPDPVQTWVDTIVAASVQAKQSAEDALASELAAKEAAESITELESNIKTAEAARVEAEKERISAENERIDAEIARSNAETSRASAEQERQTAEGTRVSAETSRETAENNRVAAETARVTAEQSRASAETARESAETDRQTTFETNEAQRQAAFETAESARESAEAQRVTAEDARATEFAGFSGEITQLKDDLDELDSRLSESIVEIERNKISKPTTADNNKFPRAKDGNVEWVEHGLPTDAQTATAVQNWLNEHPEATTTVQDSSLTYKKLVVGTLGYVTPEMFGATGNGVDDDTIFVQLALDSGLDVKLTGIYKITSTLSPVDNTTIYGGKFISYCGILFLLSGKKNISFVNIEVDENNAVEKASTFLIDNSKVIIFKNISVYGTKTKDTNDGCIKFYNASADCIVEDSSFKDSNSVGIVAIGEGTNRITIRNCVFSNLSRSSIQAKTKAKHIHVYNCTSELSGESAYSMNAPFSYVIDCTVLSLKDAVTYRGIVVGHNAESETADNSIVKNCRLLAGGITVNWSNNVTVEGCVISGNCQSAIAMDSNNCNIIDNVIINDSNSMSLGGIRVTKATNINSVDNVTISGNKIIDSGREGISISSIKNSVISKNIIINPSTIYNSYAVRQTGIYIEGEVDGYSSIIDNIIRKEYGNAVYGISFARSVDGRKKYVNGNVLEGFTSGINNGAETIGENVIVNA